MVPSPLNWLNVTMTVKVPIDGAPAGCVASGIITVLDPKLAVPVLTTLIALRRADWDTPNPFKPVNCTLYETESLALTSVDDGALIVTIGGV